MSRHGTDLWWLSDSHLPSPGDLKGFSESTFSKIHGQQGWTEKNNHKGILGIVSEKDGKANIYTKLKEV